MSKSTATQEQLVAELRKLIANTVLFNEYVSSKVGMSSSEMQSIHLLQLHGTMTPGELSAFTGLKSGSMTAVLDRLENLKLITRKPHSSDRRKILIHTNEKYISKILAPYYEHQIAHTQEVMSNFTPKETSLVTRFFQMLNQKV